MEEKQVPALFLVIPPCSSQWPTGTEQGAALPSFLIESRIEAEGKGILPVPVGPWVSLADQSPVLCFS